MSDNTYRAYVPGGVEVRLGGAREGAEAFLARAIEGEVEIALPGRYERRGDEVWDGAHTPAAVERLLSWLPARDYVLCVSILADKDADRMLELLARAGHTLIATTSSNSRALPAGELAERAARHFDRVEAVPGPHAALVRARELSPCVLVTGSLYVLTDLYQ